MQVVAVQLLPALAAAGVHEATGVGPTTILPQTTEAEGVQLPAPTGRVVPHTVAVQLLPALAATGVQEATVTAPVVTTGQVVVV